MSVHKTRSEKQLGKVWLCCFRSLEEPVWCPDAFVRNFFDDPEEQKARDGPYQWEKKKNKEEEVDKPEKHPKKAAKVKVDSKKSKSAKKTDKEEKEKEEKEKEKIDLSAAEEVPNGPVWIKHFYGNLYEKHKNRIVSKSWLSSDEIRLFMRLIEQPAEGMVWVEEGQDPINQIKKGKSMYKEAGKNTLSCLHGSSVGHWTSCTNLYDPPLFIEPFYLEIKPGFRKHLMALYPGKKDVTTVTRVNTYKQLDGWSCGYRALAYMYHMVRGKTPEFIANLYFDTKKISTWMIECLEGWKISEPPTKPPPKNAPRILGPKVPLVVEVTVTETQVKTYLKPK